MKKAFKLIYILFLIFVTGIISACQVKLGENISVSVSSASPSPSVSATGDKFVVDSLGQVEFRRILNGEKSSVRTYQVRVIRDENEFQQLWDDHIGSKTNPLFLPQVDFEQKNVLAIFLGDRPTTGFSVEIEKIEETIDTITVFLNENRPLPGDEVKAEITQPFLIIETKKSNKKFAFENSYLSNTRIDSMPFKVIENGDDSGINKFTKRIAKNEKEFSSLYQELQAGQRFVTAPLFPKIDFTKDMVAAIFIGKRPSNGYNVEVNNVIKTDSQVIISATEIPPPKTAALVDIVTTPYQFITFPKTDLPIEFDVKIIVSTADLSDSQASEQIKPLPLNIKPLLSGDNSNISRPEYYLIKTNEEYNTLWSKHTRSNDSIPPDVNFLTNSIIAVFIGKKETTGYSINVNSVIESENEIRVFIELTKDEKQEMNLITNPFEFVLIPKTNKPASFIINNLVK